MTESKDAPGGVKTLGAKLPTGLHAQFVLVAQLDGLSLADAIVRAVEHYVESKRTEGNFAERAAAALAEIEQEAAARRAAIEGLFGTDTPTPATPPAKTTRTTRKTEG
jgi:hypothetical protein